MKVVITNTQMSNGGDAAIFYAIVAVLRRTFGADVTVTAIDPMPNVAKRYYPEFEFLQAAYFALDGHFKGPLRRLLPAMNSLRMLRLRAARTGARLGLHASRRLLGKSERRALAAYERADLVVSTGGTYLIDNYDISGRLLELDLVLLAGRRPLFYTQSLGPFRKPGMADAVRPYFERSSLILLRDEQSRDHLTRIGIPPEKIHVLADSVFGFADPERLRAAGNAHTVIRRIAISVRQWSFFKGLDAKAGMQAYLAGVADAAAWLIEALDCEIVFISTCQGIPEYWAKDSLVAERAFAMLPQEARERAKVDHDFRSPIELQKILSSFDLVVATRMHMAILALSAGVPVLPIAYEFKTTELFTRLGMGDWVSPIESVATGDFRETLKRFLEFLPAHRKALFEAVELERQAAAKAEALISSTVKIDQAAREKTPRRNVQEKAGLT